LIKPDTSRSCRYSLISPFRGLPVSFAISLTEQFCFERAFTIFSYVLARLLKISLNIFSNSLTRVPPLSKHIFLMFSSALSLISISSKYLGTPPVTERSFNFSVDEIRFFLLCQNLLQSDRGSSSRFISREIRPTKSVSFKIFLSIHDEADPHNTKIRWSFFLNLVSHAILSFP